MRPKYELTTESIKIAGRTLYRIKALRSFGDVRIGDLGGFVESEDNLSHKGNCWIYDDAWVMDNALIFGDAAVYDNAFVNDDARIGGKAVIFSDARVLGDVKIRGKFRIGPGAYVRSNIDYDMTFRGLSVYRHKDGSMRVVGEI